MALNEENSPPFIDTHTNPRVDNENDNDYLYMVMG